MIYLHTTSGKHLVILEPGNIDWLRQGNAAINPTGEVAIMFTPDAVRLGQGIQAYIERVGPDKVDPIEIDRLVKESQAWPEVHNRPFHETQTMTKSHDA